MKIKTNIAISILAFALVGCGIYNAIDERINPRPEVDKQASYRIWERGGNIDMYIESQVINAEKAFWHYYCKRGDRWDAFREIDHTPASGGQVSNLRAGLDCRTMIRVEMTAYNNWNRRSQKTAGVVWVFDIKSMTE